jgi:hypothetical protein
MRIVAYGETTVGLTAVALSSNGAQVLQMDLFAGDGVTTNTVPVFLGDSAVTVATGLPILPNAGYSLPYPPNGFSGGYLLTNIYLCASVAGQKVRYVAWGN